jgi:P27 family predicted phage terminase small subunit
MGKRGPPPKPSALKKLQGTFRKDRTARNELVAPPGAPPMPNFPPKVRKIAAAKWGELVPLLLMRGTISPEDGALLERYCREWAQWLTYQAAAEREPMIETMYGPKVNPAKEMALKIDQALHKAEDRLGLSASARSKVSVPEKAKPEDTSEAFLFGKPQVIQGGKA